MKIHEYQAKKILKEFGVNVPNSAVAYNADEVYETAHRLGDVVAIKAQIHAGGRGKGGGVKIAKSPEEAERLARAMFGMKLVTYQTGPQGKEVQRVLVEAGLRIKKEYYLGIVIDRSSQRAVFMASSEGGVDIEEVAATKPEKILKEFIDPAVGFAAFQARKLAFGIGIPGDAINKAVKLMLGLYRAFEQKDASLAEINPLVLTEEGDVYALDAKMNFDDNALYRHPELLELRDFSEEDPLEIRASRFGLNYIKLDGTVGCMVNGAGLAMATMDIIKYAGGSPANFLDVGGGASQDQVKNAFQILLSDPNVKAVLINIFGGIMRCDIVAGGVVEAVKTVGVKVPVVVRLEGTNVEQGREILKNSGLNFTVAAGMRDAAEKVVKLAR
ncbi:MAG TPA: ADP-forming succinate--CoA ligase subunit beta [Acidobacteriota bacterium]|jgi:succinyl-CoA synthetase beta subunit